MITFADDQFHLSSILFKINSCVIGMIVDVPIRKVGLSEFLVGLLITVIFASCQQQSILYK